MSQLTLSLSLLCRVIALVCLFVAALPINTGRVAIGWLGLFFWCLSTLVP